VPDRLPWRTLLAVLSGGILVLAYPPFSLYGAVWFGLAPLLLAVWFSKAPEKPASLWRRLWRSRGGQGFRLGWLAGVVFFSGTFWWLLNLKAFTGSIAIAALGLFALAGYLALYWGVFGAFAATVARLTTDDLRPQSLEDEPNRMSRSLGTSGRSLATAFLLAAAWCGLEWLRGILFTGFGWNNLSVPLAAGGNSIQMIQACEWVGSCGLSFLPVFAGTIGLITVWRLALEAGTRRIRPHPDFGVAMALVAGTFLYGLSAKRSTDDAPIVLRTAVVQPNVPQLDKWDPSKAEQNREALQQCLTVAAVQPFDLVLLPEACLPFPLEDNEEMLREVLDAGTVNLVYGSDWFEWDGIPKPGQYPDFQFNSVIVRGGEPNAEPSVYHKNHLVMFGEFVPFSESIGLFGWFAQLINVGNLSAGEDTMPLRSRDDRYEFIPSVCFEDTVARLCRRFVRPGPQLIVNVTNDAWFGRSAASELHLQNALFRSVELRRPMLRSTNTGTSALVLSNGRVTRLMPAFTRGTQTVEVPLSTEGRVTFYARHGDLFSAVMLLLAAAGAIRRIILR